MKSHTTSGFRACFRDLPERIQRAARKSYKILKTDHTHPGLAFKRVGKKTNAYSVRIGLGWRALGLLEDDTMIWFWIGSHEEYNHMLRNC